MREILFRGKRTCNGEWVEGFAIFADDKAFILNNANVELVPGFNENKLNFVLQEVILESISEFTSLTDKNGTKIFEHDVVVVRGHKYIVEWGDGLTGFYPFNDYDSDCGIYFDVDECEVIGNIFDNLELLKGSESE